MQVDARDLARAEARAEAGARTGPQALEILRNIDAMELAVEEASTTGDLTIAVLTAIHTFADGNGRTGRALVHVVLRLRGLTPSYVPPISGVLAADKPRYIQGLTDNRDGDVDGWITRFASAAARSTGLAQAYLTAIEDVQATWRERLARGAAPRSDAAAWRLIDVLPAHSVITLPVAVAATGRTKAVVNQALVLIRPSDTDPCRSVRDNRVTPSPWPEQLGQSPFASSAATWSVSSTGVAELGRHTGPCCRSVPIACERQRAALQSAIAVTSAALTQQAPPARPAPPPQPALALEPRWSSHLRRGSPWLGRVLRCATTGRRRAPHPRRRGPRRPEDGRGLVVPRASRLR